MFLFTIIASFLIMPHLLVTVRLGYQSYLYFFIYSLGNQDKLYCIVCLYLVFYFISMNTCWAPHREMSPRRFTMAAIALFSASEQTHCALIVCDSKWVTVSLHSVFWLAAEVVTVLVSCYIACWCHVTLLPSQQKFSVYHTAMHQITVSLYPGACVSCVLL